MATLADFLPNPGLKLPVRQFLPKYSRTNETPTAPQIHTLWLRAISLFRPFALQIEDSFQAHKDLLRHLIKDEKAPSENPDHLTTGAASSPALRVISTPDEPWLTLADLRSPSQAPVALVLLLNAGLICAWRGENYIANQWFQRALAMDDRSSPANSVAVYFLLGCAQFLLRHYKSSRASFERCVLHFRKLVPDSPDKGDTELDLAAPWVGVDVRTLSRSFGRADDLLGETKERKLERQRAAEKERRMEKRFRYKMFVPPKRGHGQRATSPQNIKEKGNEWQEWILERTIVEGNRSVAKIRQERKESGLAGADGEELHIAGIPGGILFWPLDDPSSPHIKTAFKTRTPTAAHPSPSKRQRHDVPPPTAQTPLPPPTWNPETQAFDPYIPPPPDPVVLSHEHQTTSSEASPSSPLTFDPYSIPPTYDEDTQKNDLGVVSLSDEDSSPPPDTEGAQFLKYHPNSAPSFPVRGDSLSYGRANSLHSIQSSKFEQTPSTLRYCINLDNNVPTSFPSSSQPFRSPDTISSILPSPNSPTGTLGPTPTGSTPTDSRRQSIRHDVRRETEEARVSVRPGAIGDDVGTGRLRLERGTERKRADRYEALAALEGRRPASLDGSWGGGPSALGRFGVGIGVGASARSGSEGQGQRLRERMGSIKSLMRRSVSNFKRGSRASEKAVEGVDVEPTINNTEIPRENEDWKRYSVFMGDDSGEEGYGDEQNTGYEDEEDTGYEKDAAYDGYAAALDEEEEKENTPLSQPETFQPSTKDPIDEALEGLGAGGLLQSRAYVPP